MLLNFGIPFFFVYYLPKKYLENNPSSTPVNSSFILETSGSVIKGGTSSLIALLKDSSTIKSMVVIAASVMGFVQGLTSSLRFRNKIELSNRNTTFTLSKEQSELVRQILPLSPVPIKESTVHTGLSILPLISRAIVIYSHIYPIMRGGILTNTSLSTIGFFSWIAFKQTGESI